MYKVLLIILPLVAIILARFIRGVLRKRSALFYKGWLSLKLTGAIPEFTPSHSKWRDWLERRLEARSSASLEHLRQLVSNIPRAKRIEGLILEVHDLSIGWATCTTLRELILELTQKGIRVAVYLPRGGGLQEVYIASAATEVYAAPEVSFLLQGFQASSPYFKNTLDRAGIAVEVVACGTYKAAAEPLVRDSMSDAQAQQLAELLHARHREWIAALQNRGLDQLHAEEILKQGLLSADTLKVAGVINELYYKDQLKEHVLKGKTLVTSAWVKRLREVRWWPRRKPEGIGVIQLRGMIVDVRKGLSSMRGHAIEIEQATRILQLAAKNPRIKGVILQIDSPGGSALASDLIHREVQCLAKKKPVVACFGEVSASGGYYIATAAHTIVCQKTSVTGSIGVFALRPTFKALLERIGVSFQTVKTTEAADMLMPWRTMSESERSRLEQHLNATYERFLNVVKEGRRMSHAQVLTNAEGRIFNGAEAKARGLVDHIGGLDVAAHLVWEQIPQEQRPNSRHVYLIKESKSRLLPNFATHAPPSNALLVALSALASRPLYLSLGPWFTDAVAAVLTEHQE